MPRCSQVSALGETVILRAWIQFGGIYSEMHGQNRLKLKKEVRVYGSNMFVWFAYIQIVNPLCRVDCFVNGFAGETLRDGRRKLNKDQRRISAPFLRDPSDQRKQIRQPATSLPTGRSVTYTRICSHPTTQVSAQRGHHRRSRRARSAHCSRPVRGASTRPHAALPCPCAGRPPHAQLPAARTIDHTQR